MTLKTNLLNQESHILKEIEDHLNSYSQDKANCMQINIFWSDISLSFI